MDDLALASLQEIRFCRRCGRQRSCRDLFGLNGCQIAIELWCPTCAPPEMNNRELRRQLGYVWHMRQGKYGRAFVRRPRSPLGVLRLWLRGWRCTHENWMSKPSPNQRRRERLRDG